MGDFIAAVHEAGHVLAGWERRSHRVVGVRLDPPLTESRGDVAAAVSAAGVIAECRLLRKPLPAWLTDYDRLALLDYEDASCTCDRDGVDCGSDPCGVYRALKSGDRRGWLRAAVANTVELFEDVAVWSGVLRVAAALLDRGALDEADLIDLLGEQNCVEATT